MDDDALLEEQRAFYRARASEYDEWWLRQGRYDRGDNEAREWREQVAVVEAALAAFGATGDVLELAGGTGWWTARLAETATHLTVVDSSLETLELNRERVGRAEIDYVVADLFDWQPTRPYDVVFFSFWLSHVPRARFAAFWSLVRACLAPGGRVFLIDNRPDPVPRPNVNDPHVVKYSPDLHLRRLSDGSEFRVVKVMYEPDELQTLIEAEGWRAAIGATRWFLFGSAELT
jgi:demethylmenaquinone methyltransferase/2-methoxy-6-polyprenyl-1,4-benzoquinol methylase